MKNIALMLVLATLPLAAGGRSLEGGLLLGQAKARTNDFAMGNSPDPFSYRQDPEDPITLGLCFGIDLLQSSKFKIQATAAWQPIAKSDVNLTSEANHLGGTYRASEQGRYGYGYASLGGRFSFRVPLEWGLGLEVRSEKVEISSELNPGVSASLTRPWLTLHAGQTWAGEAVSPFVRLEFNLPLARTSAVDRSNPEKLAEEITRTTAPNNHVLLVGGFRF